MGKRGMMINATTATGTPKRTKGIRRPHLVRKLSLHAPTRGLMNNPAMLSKTRIKPVRAGPRPKPTVVAPASVKAGFPACKKTGIYVLYNCQMTSITAGKVAAMMMLRQFNLIWDIFLLLRKCRAIL